MNDRFSADDLPMRGRRGLPASPWPIDLAHHRPFQLGTTEVRPASREVVAGGRREVIEPRVMQVLVVLAAAKGAILSRDDLIAACWHGRAVSDDAVNRVISRLRAISHSLGGFEVETITKVGYRLIAAGQKPHDPASPDRRRLLAAGGAAAGLAAIGASAWWSRTRPVTSNEGAILLQKGLATLQNVDIIETPEPGISLQALTLLAAAAQAMPQSASAWGALAIAYAARKRAVPAADRPGLDVRGRDAARTALTLDPNEGGAIAALRLLDPPYGKWVAAERADRDVVQRQPNIAILSAIMSSFLGGVGRWREAATFTKRIDRRNIVIPGMEWRLLVDLWSSGDLQAADQQREFAATTWPQHARVWLTSLAYLMYSGRPAEALAIIGDEGNVPVEVRSEQLSALRVTAEALAGHRPKHQAAVVNLDHCRVRPAAALDTARALVAMGEADAALPILEGYYFGRGEWAKLAPQGGDQDRLTGVLFQPVMRPLWRHEGFSRLLDRIGLEAYWRQSQTLPDFRRQ